MILDDDLIEYLDFYDCGVASLYSDWLEWIVEQFTRLVKDRIDLLSNKFKKEGYPQIYWVAPPHYSNFTNNWARSKMLGCLEVLLKNNKLIRLIRMKEIWDYENVNLVRRSGIMTEEGLDRYWSSIDAAVRFNAKKKEQFAIRNSIQALNKKTPKSGAALLKPAIDGIPKFFEKHKNDKYRWTSKDNCVRLPKP